MLSTQMMILADRNQWKNNPEESTVFGDYNGYLFTGLEGKRFKAFITSLAGINPDSLQSILQFLDKNARVLRLYNYEVTDNFLCVRLREGLIPLTAEKMEYLLAQISGLLSLGELPTGLCAICGEPAARKGLYYGLFCHLHPECQDREPVNFTAQFEEKLLADEEIPANDDEPKDDEASAEDEEPAVTAETGSAGGK